MPLARSEFKVSTLLKPFLAPWLNNHGGSTFRWFKRTSLRAPESTNDEGISMPYNFKHEIHVSGFDDEGRLLGFPEPWISCLEKLGFSQQEIARMLPHNRRMGYELSEKDVRYEDSSYALLPVEMIPPCPSHEDCPFQHIDLQKSHLVFKAIPGYHRRS
ncbi:hypothetical protein BDW22DRAFT_1362949 [Trametopsis cervina]|nr:hypothetical protein BDW22DRAFT_1362949 [Trametopsis cervina]